MADEEKNETKRDFRGAPEAADEAPQPRLPPKTARDRGGDA